MPDPQKLLTFMQRAQEHLQSAMDNKDPNATKMYQDMLRRSNAVGERMLSVTGHFPVVAGGNQPTPYNNYPTSQPSNDEWFMAGDEPAQNNSASATPSAASTPPQQAATQSPQTNQSGQVQGTPLFNLQDLNKGGVDKLTLDLEQEIRSPFAAGPNNPVDSVIQRYPTAKPAPYTGPTSANVYAPSATPSMAAPSFNSMAYTEGLPTTEGATPQIPDALKILMSTEKVPGGLLFDVPGVNAPGQVPGTGFKPEAEKPPMKEPPMQEEPSSMPSEWEINPSLRGHFDKVKGWSEADHAKNKAAFEENAEFERRVEREYGKKPSFVENLLAILLGGLRGGQMHSQKIAQYQQGRGAIGREMRSEARGQQAMVYKAEKDKMDRALEMQKMSSMFLPRAAQVAMKPHIVNAERINARIDSIIRNPAYDPSKPNPEVDALKVQYQLALQQAEEAAAPVTQMLPKSQVNQ